MTLENIILYFILPVMSISMLLIFIRLYKGPRLIDRVVALDLLMIVGIGAFSAYSVLHNNEVFIDISLILALIAFLSTVAFTWYYVKGDTEKDKFDER
ncbi:MAG: cation:proton antiporter [Bacteroidetes bacterium]|jgi:multicomponent Na+:H+ antiporter subunit F|nr:cation:proton antiporter [Bacteroidota bacterium]